MRTSTGIAAASLVVIVASIVAFVATGAEVFTKLPSESLERSEGEDDLGALFEDTGLDESHAEMQHVENRLALGLLPSGPGAGALSVATLSIPAAFVGGWALRMRFKRASSTPAPDSQEQTP